MESYNRPYFTVQVLALCVIIWLASMFLHAPTVHAFLFFYFFILLLSTYSIVWLVQNVFVHLPVYKHVHCFYF